MAQNVTLYNLLISCPGDVKDEVGLIETTVDEFNELYAETLGITIKTRHWSKSSYAQSGGKPQPLLNEQFVSKCDAAVAIFWTKFGSPTDEYGSGTEEEIEIMLQSNKQVFMYFSDKTIPPSQMNSDGYKQILSFREKYKDRGVYFTYSTDEEFKKIFFAHLSMYFLAEKRVKENAIANTSKLKILGIDEKGKLSDEASIYSFALNTETTLKQYVESIKDMYTQIAQIPVGKKTTSMFNGLNFTTSVEIDSNEQKILCDCADELKIELPDSFFDLGNLEKNTLSSNVLTGPTLKGTKEEKQKYWKIQKLLEKISKALEWAPIEKAFSEKQCLRLAIQNCGKAIDEDVEISFEIPKKSLLTLDEFPKFNNNEMNYMLNDCDMYILFGIDSTAEYIDYSESERRTFNSKTPHSYGLPGYTPDNSDDFIAELTDVFCYSIYSNGDKYIIKLKVDYIKHNTTVAFPTILFIKDKVDEIPYRITSKNNPNIIEDIIKVL